MLMHRIARSFVSRRHSRSRRRTADDRTVPACEVLEPRMLLSAANAPFVETGAYDTTHILVGFDQQVVSAGTPLTALAGTKIGDAVSTDLGLYVVELDAGMSVEDAVVEYAADPSVTYAQPDYEVRLNLDPNDPYYGSLWGMQAIDAPQAWDVTTGDSNIVVAVVDTGIDYTHPDLAANIWTNSAEANGTPGVDDDGDGYIDDVHGWDFYNNDSDPMDDNSHGTHVAGTIGGIGNNATGVVGVNWNVTLMPLKFLSSGGYGYTSDAVAAINYARRNGADIINASWGGGGYSTALNNAIQAFDNNGGIFVASAGNSARSNDSTASYPANYPNVVSVAATTQSDALAYFSNYGVNTVDIAAPGYGILSTVPGGYASYSGTSMAAPHVSGAMALVWAAHPDWTNTQVVDAVLNNADPILLNRVTHGRLNVAAAIGDVSGPGDTTGPRVTHAAWSGPQSGTLNSIRVTFNESVNPDTFAAGDVLLTGPNGRIDLEPDAVTPVPNSNNRQFDITFATQSAEGTYTVSIGPDLTDAAGNLMNQDGDSTNGELIQDVFTGTATISSAKTYTWTGSAPIRDWSLTQVYLPVNENFTIDDIDVRVRIQHTWDSDLAVAVIDPTGYGRWLIYRRGGSGDNIYATFDDEASTPVSAGSAPFDGTFRPESSLDYFDGKSAQGYWRLYVIDYAWGDWGQVTEFSLIITPQAGAASIEPPADGAADAPAAKAGTPVLSLDFGHSAEQGSSAISSTPLVAQMNSPALTDFASSAGDSTPSLLDDDHPTGDFSDRHGDDSLDSHPAGVEHPDLDAVFRDFGSCLHGELAVL